MSSPKASPRQTRSSKHRSPRVSRKTHTPDIPHDTVFGSPHNATYGSSESSYFEDESRSSEATDAPESPNRETPDRSQGAHSVTKRTPLRNAGSPQSGYGDSETSHRSSPGEKLYPSLDGLEEPNKSPYAVRRSTRKKGSPNQEESQSSPKYDSGHYKPYIKERHAQPTNIYGKKDTTDELMKFLIGVVAIIIVIAGVFFVRKSPDKTPVQPETEIVLNRFQEEFHNLKSSFPNQHKKLWPTIAAPIKRIFREDKPIQPATILLAADQSGHAVVDCIASRLAAIVRRSNDSSAQHAVEINTAHLRGDPDDAKLDMDERLGDAFRSRNQVVVLENLELLHPVPAMLLHGYCDNENAPYKKVVLILTLHIRSGSEEGGGNALGPKQLVEEELRRAWEPIMGTDNFYALMSRIANSIAFVQKEDVDTMKKVCGG